jgi:hydrogenase expression/formation protein HypC
MQIVRLEADGQAVADLDGAQRNVDLSLVSDAAVGEYVIVHAGFAIEKLDETEAQQQLALFRELAAAGRAAEAGRMPP